MSVQNEENSQNKDQNGAEGKSSDKRCKTRGGGLRHWLWPVEFLIFLIGFAIAAMTFYWERDDRRNQRLVESWQLLTEVSPGASGKILALEYLHKVNEELTAIDLSRSRHGAPAYLLGLDVYDEKSGRGSEFRLANFAGAILRGANLSKSDFFGSCLYGVEFGGATLAGTNFTQADLTKANLWGADLSNANLDEANLSGTHMDKSEGLTQEQLDTAYFCETPPRLPERLQPPPERSADGCVTTYFRIMGFQCDTFEPRR